MDPREEEGWVIFAPSKAFSGIISSLQAFGDSIGTLKEADIGNSKREGVGFLLWKPTSHPLTKSPWQPVRCSVSRSNMDLWVEGEFRKHGLPSAMADPDLHIKWVSH